ncbi:MAG TPA: glycoside hydrolase family 3 C-terminal domain-containing protein [Terriglobia bacterium]|nr:glycoside hydrolase family 3 C-terminal domain-containing protein [Terriglobia bacterium]
MHELTPRPVAPRPASRTLLLVLAALFLAAVSALAQTPAPAVTGNPRVDKLLSQMTLEEKIAMIHGAQEPTATDQGQAGYLPGVPRLGIPSLRLADGPPGVLTRQAATGLTATMGLAATWSRKDAEQNGVVVGRDARSLGIDVVLQPFINIDRDITFERGYNVYGEDPLLSGQIGAGFIRGVQGQGVMAQAKHYVAYDGGDNVFVDPQTLHEIYVAPFVDAVEAGVSSIMCSYNKINGPYACGNGDNLNTILKHELGFKGFVTSDWGATHGTLFINQGLDLEMPGPMPDAPFSIPTYFTAEPPPPPSTHPLGPGTMEDVDFGFSFGGIPEEPQNPFDFSGFGNPAPVEGMMPALKAGEIKEETITRAVGRILFEMDKFGFLDGKGKHSVTPIESAGNAPIVRKTGEDAAVLLKNEDGALPLKPADLDSLALIGPGAGQTIAIGEPGEKALGIPERQIGTLEAVRKLAPTAKVTYAVADDMTGTAVPAGVLSHDGQPGLLRTDAKTKATQVDPQLNFTKSNHQALPAGGSYTWTGTLNAPSAGDYLIYLQILGTSGALSVDGKRIVSSGNPLGNLHGNVIKAGEHNVLPTTDGLDNMRHRLSLTAGPHALSVTARADTSGAPVQIRLSWVTREQQKANYDAALTAAKNAKTVVVFVWGRGRPDFGLPGDQAKLIDDIAAINPNTIVVMNLSQPVAMPWLDKVKAVFQMWYPGDEGGWATANLLLGKVSPAGRLPFTWPKRLQDGPANDPSHPERSSKGVQGKTTYAEGINVGYRWFDQQNIEPQFPFGFGLSYTTFEYSGLKISRAADGGLEVSFTLRNAGKVTSDEVPQVYLGAPKEPPGGAQFAVKALAAFDRVSVPAGQSKTITLHLPRRRLEYWSTADNRWDIAAGSRILYVASSSRDVRLQHDVNIAGASR